MNQIRAMLSLPARLGLLLTIVLHLGATVALPSVHLAGEASSVAQSDDRSIPPDDRGSHDEQSCVLCHALGQLALEPNGPALLPARVVAVRERHWPYHRVFSRTHLPAHARGPPSQIGSEV